MALPPMTAPNIKLLMQGILILSIDETQRHNTCQIGVVGLDDVDGHPLSVTVKKITYGAGGSSTTQTLRDLNRVTLKPNVKIDIGNNPGSGGIKTHPNVSSKPVFSRSAGNNDPNDFSWVLNFEGAEVYDDKQNVDIHRDGFSSIIEIVNINSALFYVPDNGVSEDGLFKVEHRQPMFLGQIAVIVGANFPIDSSTNAAFVNGTDRLQLPYAANVTYLITVDQSCPGGRGDNDTVLFDRVIDGSHTQKKQINFFSENAPLMERDRIEAEDEGGEPINPPDAVCFVGSVNQPIIP